MPPRAPTIADVAAAAGTSIRTVSRVLNASPKVSADARARIEAAIAELGFVPSGRARAFASGRSHLIGVIQGDENASVLGQVQRGIAGVCAASGHELIVHPAAGSGDALIADIVGFVRRSRVDGLIILSPTSEDPALPEALAQAGVPAVALASAAIPGLPAMQISDDRGGAALVAHHLADLGHTRVATITGPAHRLSTIERREGFRDALATRGLVLGAAMIVEGDYSFASGRAGATVLLDLPDPPTAIFAANDLMAAGLLQVALQRGLAVPGDVAVAGFDGTDLAEMLTPTLTTVHRPLAEMARRATERLLGVVAGQERSPLQTSHTLLIARSSSATALGR